MAVSVIERVQTFFLVIIPYTIYYSNYSHSVYIVLGVLSNPDIIGMGEELNLLPA